MDPAESVNITVCGRPLVVHHRDVLAAVDSGTFGPVRQHAVEINGALYPVKEVFARVTGLDVLDFNTVQARTTLRRLGFRLRTVS